MRLSAVILAAGQGTRMKSALPKVLHQLGGKPLVLYAVETATRVTGASPVLVVGHGADQVRAALGNRVRYASQPQQLGTGHAVLQARELLAGQADAVLVTYADMPLLTEQTLRELVESHRASGAVLTMLTVVADDPRGFGRVVRKEDGSVQAVVEEASATPEQLAIRELNAGVYCFDAPWLWQSLPGLPLSPKGEYYLTDMVGLAVQQGRKVTAVSSRDPDELMGINTRVHLAEAEQFLRRRINRRWMEAGVTLLDPETTYIEPTVVIGQDTTIFPNSHLRGDTVIGRDCRIGPSSVIEDSHLGDRVVVLMSVLESSVIEAGRTVGPFTHLHERVRPPGDAPDEIEIGAKGLEPQGEPAAPRAARQS